MRSVVSCLSHILLITTVASQFARDCPLSVRVPEDGAWRCVRDGNCRGGQVCCPLVGNYATRGFYCMNPTGPWLAGTDTDYGLHGYILRRSVS
ncbi:hypothetical protein BV898_17218 [Hypsibius exemplaris]|uniref:WAP domain-containing protein n=1 Tax=Hypsibius exemplaris TaxID=2072580 RepID=A0A9X6RM78_HYPEX|nr:hypothetical protein BV898_17218 [Hypsibius exemplaris]